MDEFREGDSRKLNPTQNMNITELLKSRKNLELNIPHDEERMLSLPVQLGTGDPFTDGCQLHAALVRLSDHKVLTPRERRLWPVIAVLRAELRTLGAEKLIPEKRFRGLNGAPGGRADIVVSGHGRTGIVELKVVGKIPTKPRGCDIAQTGAYLNVASLGHVSAGWWAAIAYIDLERGELRIFVFRREIERLARGAVEVLAA